MLTRAMLGTLLSLCLLGPVFAQNSPPEATAAISRQTAERIASSLDDIALSLRLMAEDRTAMLAIRRVELAEKRLAPLDSKVTRARDALRSAQREYSRLQSMTKSFENQVDEAERSGSPLDESFERDFEEMRAMLEIEKEQVADEERRLREAEDELARAREQIEILDAELASILEARSSGRR